ncbi:MAG TPA: helix-hairpin-helix domain-containing protein [Polyangiaceae bacterium]|nr:helix-hairpin-helix domain-containing protein [Polyangiaceae bacterium]
MAGPALKLAVSEPPIDINEASATEIREALPGIGEKLAMRIVAYRDEHGPFETANDLTRIPGINEKRISRMADRISLTPPNSGYQRSVPETVERESLPPSRRFSINSDAFPGSFAPSLDSLLPRGPEEPSHGASLMPSARPMRSDVGGSILSAAPARMKTVSPHSAPVERVVQDTEAFLHIPLNRPWRIWVVLAGLGLFSALGGAIFGVRSQDGGPRGQLERNITRVRNDVADISGSVQKLDSQATTFADSINLLDARLSEQEQKTNPRAKLGSYATAKTPEKSAAPTSVRRDTEESPARRRVRQAMTEFESSLPSAAGEK